MYSPIGRTIFYARATTKLLIENENIPYTDSIQSLVEQEKQESKRERERKSECDEEKWFLYNFYVLAVVISMVQ